MSALLGTPHYAVRTTWRRPLACYHEAGHCLARWYFGHYADRAVVLTVAQVRAGEWPIDRKGRTAECEGIVEGYDMGPNPHFPRPDLSSLTASDRARIDLHDSIGTDMELVNASMSQPEIDQAVLLDLGGLVAAKASNDHVTPTPPKPKRPTMRRRQSAPRQPDMFG